MTDAKKEQIDFAKRELSALGDLSLRAFERSFWRKRLAYLESDNAPALGCLAPMKHA